MGGLVFICNENLFHLRSKKKKRKKTFAQLDFRMYGEVVYRGIPNGCLDICPPHVITQMVHQVGTRLASMGCTIVICWSVIWGQEYPSMLLKKSIHKWPPMLSKDFEVPQNQL